ncbi:MAG: histidine kinase [Cyclobacteriaceae bacterium]
MVINRKAILLHITFWVVYTLIFTITDGGYSNRFDRAFFIELAHLPLRLVVVYLNYFILFPKLLLTGKYYRYAFYTVVSLIVAALLQRGIMFYYVSPILYPQTTDIVNYFIPYKLLQAGVIINSPLVFMIGFSVLHHVFKLRDKTEKLEKENLQSELKFLRAQINPHFFFNTLNSLYGLTQEKSDRAPEVVLKLSELMSFVLYETDQERISLSKELKYIKNYIELEEIRYGDRFVCNLSIHGNTEVLIPPLLMLPFIENSFKHGIKHESDKGWVNIYVSVIENKFIFKIENSIGEISAHADNGQNGLGIANVKRRLELLYPESHRLSCNNEEKQFRVELEIDL